MEKWVVAAMAFLLTVFVCLVPILPDRVRPEAVIEGRPVSSWTQQLKSPDAEQRRDAAALLGKLGPEAKDAVPGLAAALKDEDRAVRILAARALGQIGPEAKAAVPDLRESIVNNRDGLSLRETLAAVHRIEGLR